MLERRLSYFLAGQQSVDQVVDKIIAMTPYGGARDFLFGMHEFDRTRKHTRLAANGPTHAGAGIVSGRVTHMHFPGLRELTNSWQTLATIGPGTSVNMQLQYQISFLEPEQIKGMNILDGLDRFLKEAREIVQAFTAS